MSSKHYVKNTIKHFKCVFDMIGANIFVKKGHQMVILMTTYFYPVLKICQESFFRNECQLMTKC